jgi:hypothetical protein
MKKRKYSRLDAAFGLSAAWVVISIPLHFALAAHERRMLLIGDLTGHFDATLYSGLDRFFGVAAAIACVALGVLRWRCSLSADLKSLSLRDHALAASVTLALAILAAHLISPWRTVVRNAERDVFMRWRAR